jgi:hypothetical protein
MSRCRQWAVRKRAWSLVEAVLQTSFLCRTFSVGCRPITGERRRLRIVEQLSPRSQPSRPGTKDS